MPALGPDEKLLKLFCLDAIGKNLSYRPVAEMFNMQMQHSP
jgi:hypothetical protein